MSFGMMEAMLSLLRRQIGLRTDSADAAGSLHAKVGELRNYLIANYLRLRSATWYSHTGGFAPENAETTLFSASDRGIAIMGDTASAYGANIGSNYPSTQLKIYVDGTLKQTINFGTVDANATVTKTGILPVFKFNTSFAINGSVGYNSTGVSGSVGVTFTYTLSCFVES